MHTSNGWTRLDSDTGAGPALHITRLRWAIDQLDALGESVAASSRLRRALATLDRERTVLPDPAEHPREFALTVEATRCALELLFILLATVKQKGFGGPFTRARIRELDGGSDLPADDGNPAKARDTQFELFVAALFALADYPVRAGEDFEFAWEGEWLTVQAKRLTSLREDAVVKRLKKAAAQIGGPENQGALVRSIRSRGLIALSVDSRIPEQEFSQDLDARVQEYQAVLTPIARSMVVLEREPQVMGVMLFGCHSEYLLPGNRRSSMPELIVSYAVSTTVMHLNGIDRSLGREMAGILRTRLQHVIRTFEFTAPRSIFRP